MRIGILKAVIAGCLVAAASLLALALAGQPAVRADSSDKVPYYCVTGNSTVCLTVDDGFGRKNIQRILKALKEENVRCTFFVVGDALKRNADLWQQAVDDGNDICYHTMHHQNLTKLSDAKIQADLDEWNVTICGVLPGYVSPKYARLPGGDGHTVQRILRVFQQNGYSVVGWSIQDPMNEKVSSIVAHIKYATKSNSIILIHFKPCDASALPEFLGWLNSHFTLSKVSESIPLPTPTPEPSPTPTPPHISLPPNKGTPAASEAAGEESPAGDEQAPPPAEPGN